MNERNLSNPKRITLGASLLCFFISGISFWRIPYSNVTLPDSFYGAGVLVVFATAAALSFRFSFRKGLLLPGLVFPAVLMTRVIAEGVVDPTRHNLWPLALTIAVLLGFAVSGSGATLGWLAAKLFR